MNYIIIHCCLKSASSEASIILILCFIEIIDIVAVHFVANLCMIINKIYNVNATRTIERFVMSILIS